MSKESASGMKGWQKVLLGVLSLFLFCVLGAWLWFCHVRASVTEESVRDVPVAQVTERDRKELLPRYRKVERSLRQHRDVELVLSGDDCDKLIASVDRLKRLRGRLSVQLEGDHAWVGASVPLSQIPLFRNRYLNGRFKVSMEVEGSQVRVRILEALNGSGKPYPGWLVKQLNELLKSPEQFDAFAPGVRRHLESLQIADGKMVVKIRGKKQ